MVTDAQVKRLRQKRMDGKTQAAAAAAAAMSERTARTWEKGPLPSQRQRRRGWRTRPDPFAGVWEPEVVPLLDTDEAGVLQAKTLLAELMARHPERFTWGQLRTLQRRIRDWRALHGPEREVFFPQEPVPGRCASLDFTHATELGVTVGGAPFAHLLFVFKLSFSGWTWVSLAFSETFEALVSGLQGALWELGGVPEKIRHDNLSAATHELRKSGGRALNARFQEVLDHYRLSSSRIVPGEAHQNGVAEKGNDLTKRALAEALVLRGHRDFATASEYETWVRDVVNRTHNRSAAERLAAERAHLRPLPSWPVPDYSVYRPKVRRWSTIRVAGRTYSVPSRLIGHEVEVRCYANDLEVYYTDQRVATVPRLRGDREARIDYRHIIGSLVRKPGAFAAYRYREELFPSLTFRRAYDALRARRGERADVDYVRILHLAARTLESWVERVLEDFLECDVPLDYAAVRAQVQPEAIPVPEVTLPRPNLAAYDALLGGAR